MKKSSDRDVRKMLKFIYAEQRERDLRNVEWVIGILALAFVALVLFGMHPHEAVKGDKLPIKSESLAQ